MCGPIKFCQRGSISEVFLVDEGEESRPSSARQRNAIKMAFRWRADEGSTLNAGLVALGFFRGSGPILLRKPIALGFFRGWGGGGGADIPVPSVSVHMFECFILDPTTYI